MRNVEINVGKRCNGSCIFCLDGKASAADAKFMPFEQLCAELERFRREGFESVGFLGGEPSIYPHVVAAIATAGRLGYRRIAIATNALRLPRELVNEMVAAGLTRVTISMHGHNAQLEDRLTAVPGSYERKRRAIEHLRAHQGGGRLRDGVSINAVLNGLNYPHLPRMLKRFFGEFGVDDLRVNFVRAEGNAAQHPELTPSYTEVIPALTRAILYNEYHFKKTFTFGGIPLCVLPQQLLASRWLMRRVVGDAFRDLETDCSIRSEGYDDGVSRVEGVRARFNWRERKRRDLKHSPESCSRCELGASCDGVWRDYLALYGDEEFAPVKRQAGVLRRERPLLTRPPEQHSR